MISLEQYADLCALMADTHGVQATELAIAAAHQVTPPQWIEAKAYYTAKMTDPDDLGRTALAFMPLYQAAQRRAGCGTAPCPLEVYTRIHAEMAFRTDALGNRLNYHLVLAEHGFHHVSWLACESYWTPRVVSGLDPKFDAKLAARFHTAMRQESDRLIELRH